MVVSVSGLVDTRRDLLVLDNMDISLQVGVAVYSVSDRNGHRRRVQWWSVVVGVAGLVDTRRDFLVLDNMVISGGCGCLWCQR